MGCRVEKAYCVQQAQYEVHYLVQISDSGPQVKLLQSFSTTPTVNPKVCTATGVTVGRDILQHRLHTFLGSGGA